ncbi:glycosyl transferase [Roseateles violae]|uniref:Glycosyl transferase n=1 Tax=Roseateles violae TaxID=3058042 RepID=A0ABT8DSA1_9BURK|nr:glycosyl transferase [Pelomonas sp. PFR6]MDN3920853.1 glycosyl transferase [Pelomonas sp. PFR6]
MKKRVLLVASGGGHWVQLLRIRQAWADMDIAYVTVQESYRSQVADGRFYRVTDATRWDRWKLLRMIAEMALIVLRERPDVVITTGAAPGVAALRLGKWFGARTVWIDSIANVEAMSMSGQKVRAFADLWLTQWEHLARDEGPRYEGAVL